MWTDPRGETGQFAKVFDPANVLRQVQQDAMSIQWTEASRYRNGLGLQHGADLYPLRKAIKHQKKKKEEGAPGFLMSLACASCWTTERMAGAFPHECAICPRCGQAPESELHRHWQCSANIPSTPKLVEEYRRLAQEAVSQSAMAEPCLWLRGILPANATAVPLPADHYDLIIDGTFELRPNSRIYLDGSGLHSSDVRIRRCGFSIVHRVGQHTVGTIHSALPGANQSTPRAELLALVILLELHGQSIAATDTPIISDCQYVRGRVCQSKVATGRRMPKSLKNMDL